MKVLAVIPARWASTRFPGKPLADLLGRPMIAHVWDAVRAAGLDGVVATDDDRIVCAVEAFGGVAVLTRADHPTGTDRLAEVAESRAADVYLNVQGDEPAVAPALLRRLADVASSAGVRVATACHPIGAEEARDPNRVKVVRTAAGDAAWFSRSPLPYPRFPSEAAWLQHVGVYAFRRDVLRAFPTLPQPPEERAEGLEQLRLLSAGVPIRVIDTPPGAPGVDTPEDLARAASWLRSR